LCFAKYENKDVSSEIPGTNAIYLASLNSKESSPSESANKK
jgi:hypothetical protein